MPDHGLKDRPGSKRQTRQRTNRQQQQSTLPMWSVVLIDDEQHTYAYVVNMLGRLFAMPTPTGFAAAFEVDTLGRCVVLKTHRELAELKRDQILAFGNAAMPGCRGSMRAIIEPTDGDD